MSNGSNTFDWEELILLADSLKDNKTIGTEEAINRSVINRAYFGAFCLARNLAKDNNWIKLANNGSDHEKVKQYYKGNNNKTKQQIGILLERLHTDRKHADYDDVCCSSKEATSKIVRRAQEVRAKLNSLP